MLLECGEVFELAPSADVGNSKCLPALPHSASTTVTGKAGLSAPTPSPVHLIEEKVFAQFSDKAKKDGGRWVLDSGASNHMTGVREFFAELNTNICGTIRFGDRSVVEIEGIGTVMFIYKTGEHRSLSGVYLIPKLTTNIISLGQLDELGYEIHIKRGVMWVPDEQQVLLAKVQCSTNRSYVLCMQVTQPVNLVGKGADSAWLWHARFGHLNFRALHRLAREELVKGLLEIDHVDQLRTDCLVGKQRRAPFPKRPKHRAKDVLRLVHDDICGPISPTTPSGNWYFILLVDDVSWFMWVKMLATKDRAADAIRQYQATAETEIGRKLKVFRFDRGGEFTSTEFTNHCVQHGVRRQLMTPYTPQQNGIVEQRNQTVVGTARSMMKAKGLLGISWGEVVATAVDILNRSSTKGVARMAPYEAWYGKKPVVHHLRTFGYIAYVKNTSPNLKKLDDRSHTIVFIGYERGTKGYRVYDPSTGRVHVPRDVVFDE
jgi:transposase InsO family protein